MLNTISRHSKLEKLSHKGKKIYQRVKNSGQTLECHGSQAFLAIFCCLKANKYIFSITWFSNWMHGQPSMDFMVYWKEEETKKCQTINLMNFAKMLSRNCDIQLGQCHNKVFVLAWRAKQPWLKAKALWRSQKTTSIVCHSLDCIPKTPWPFSKFFFFSVNRMMLVNG